MTRSMVLALALFTCASVARSQTAAEIVQRSEDLLKGTSSKGKFRMTVVTPEFTRSMEMESWWVGNEKALVTITAPPREAGNKTLKVGNELWMYLRNTETTIKVPPSMMLQSWNGSDFTNDDIVRESNLVRDYTMAVLGTEPIDGAACWKIELRPKPSAPVVWGRILHWVRTEDYLAARSEYFDEAGTIMRTMTYGDIRKFGGRTIPSRWTLVSNQKEGHRTTFEFLEAAFDVPISPRVFSFQELEKGRK